MIRIFRTRWLREASFVITDLRATTILQLLTNSVTHEELE
jgi:hypothetical protein